ncbi:MAG: outer membrane protein transport protein [Flavobacteriaceae bacterium]|nr:outer membrane protein transport protein [Flavobacteriaceae bacterium]
MRNILIPIAVLSASLVYAGGFRVSLQGVKQLAMAHTSAHAEDASVAFFNPAGMSFIPNKLSVVAGGFGVLSKVTFQNPDTRESYSTENPLGTPFYAAIAYKVVDEVSLGVSVTTPFGSTIQWPKGWAGNEIVDKMQLKSFFIQPAVSVKMADWVSVGVSYIYAKGSVSWDRTLNNFGGTMNIKDNEAKGHGFGLGFYFKPNEKWDISVAYRSPVDMKAENGMLTFNTSPALFPIVGLDEKGQDKFKGTLPLVEEYTIGATYKITPKWQVSADFNYTGWSKYDALTLDFENAKVGNQADRTILVSPKNFKNTQTWRFGTQYQFSDFIAGRLGYYYDQSPYEDKDFIPETPSFNNNVITGGIGLNFNKIKVDISGGYAFMKSRKSENDYLGFYGQAKSKAAYFGLGISYNPF